MKITITLDITRVEGPPVGRAEVTEALIDELVGFSFDAEESNYEVRDAVEATA